MTLTQIKPAGLSKPVDLADNEKIRLGTGNDLQIYHISNHSTIENSTGELRIKNTSGSDMVLNSTGRVQLQVANGEKAVYCNNNGAVELYYDNSKKFETTNSGVALNGTAHLVNSGHFYPNSDGSIQLGLSNRKWSTINGVFLNINGGDAEFRGTTPGSTDMTWDQSENALNFDDNVSAHFGNGDDLQIYHDGTDSHIDNTTGELALRGATVRLRGNPQNNETLAVFEENDAAKLYYDNSKKLETTSTGVSVTGQLGIGTTSPDTQLVVSSSDHTGVTIESSRTTATDNIGSLQFQSGSTDVALIQTLVNGTIKFRNTSSLTERMRIDSSGNVGIGTTSPSQKLHLKDTAPQAQFESSSYSSYVGTAQSNDNIANGSKAGNLVLRGQTGVAITGNGGTATQVKIDADGLKFNSDTAAANALDDYEEGTYSPALGANGNISGGNGLGCTYSTQIGYYVKIGSFVFCNGILVWTAKSGTLSNTSVNLTLSIPFAQNNNNNQGAGQLSYNSAIDFNADCRNVHGVGSNSYIYFERVSTGSGKHTGYVKTENLDSSGQINFAYSYRVL